MSSSQNPLTETPAPDIDWKRENTPVSASFDDIYFSVDGGLEETKAVFLQGCNLPEAWIDQQVFTIFELGFGSALNFLACLELWTKTAKPDQRLHFISVEAFPWSRADLKKALKNFPELQAFAPKLIEAWPGRVKGTHRLHFGNVHLTLYHMQIDDALNSYAGPLVNAWFMDGFSPSKNPQMWTQLVLDKMANLSAPRARIGTFTVAGSVRRGLEQAGFAVSKQPGFGRKRERLEAIYPDGNGAQSMHRGKNQPIIIGAGIAGASIARAFLRRGIAPICIDKEPGLETAASGNPAAMIMPRLDLQDRPESRFFLSAYLYAVSQYRKAGHILHTGALQMAKSEEEQTRFEKIIGQRSLPETELQSVTSAAAASMLDANIQSDLAGLYFPNALTINPKATISEWIQGATRLVADVSELRKSGSNWHVRDGNDDVLAESDIVFVTMGADILQLDTTEKLAVRFTRGQLSWGPYDRRPAVPVNYGGYALKLNGGILLGATNEHVGQGQTSHTIKEDDQKNEEDYAQFLGTQTNGQYWNSRASVRVTTKDTLPISTQISDGLSVLTGLGSRGFLMAPLLGEALVCDALGEPSPVNALWNERENLIQSASDKAIILGDIRAVDFCRD